MKYTSTQLLQQVWNGYQTVYKTSPTKEVSPKLVVTFPSKEGIRTVSYDIDPNEDSESRRRMVQAIGRMVDKDDELFGVYFVMEAWLILRPPGTAFEAPPSEATDRQEVLVIEAACGDGMEILTSSSRITRTETETTLSEPEVFQAQVSLLREFFRSYNINKRKAHLN